ncbi:alpha/beta fold hydrolase [Burkholderia sp. Ac-20379]|uniref:alpha/beta fold hydrolase n=1 Tax=Burkholderia sp. Ac-20379 TaxID=2703900 RepID=UPI00197FAE6F|nr:alpha/beta hydrolase [Burkholderia sp. Ac-20379]MBN3729185.1 alpha/beta fold hydrolase [Burkholderia sp. Ac-20379]
MSQRPPAIFIHGFIGTLEIDGYAPPHAAPPLLGYGAHRDTPAERIALPEQVAHLRAFVDAQPGMERVDLVGHSVGGAIAMLFAHAHPERVRRIVSIEGNFTLDDAFWSASVGRMTAHEAEAMLAGFRADPARWLGGAVANVTPTMARTAAGWLDHQPAATLRAMGRSVVDTTGRAAYLDAVEAVFARHRVCLVAGERSRGGWHVPGWARERCAAYEIVPGSGHLPAIEQPAALAAVLDRFFGEADAA